MTDLINKLDQKKTSKEVRLFYFIVYFTIFSGAIRKWVVTSELAGNIIFLIQLIIPYLYILLGSNKLNRVFNNRVFAFYLIYLIICAVNPKNQTIYHGLFGILLHSCFWFLLIYYIENREYFSFHSNYSHLLFVGGFLIAFSSVQYFLPPENILNKYVNEKAVGNIATVGDKVRVTATFSFISGYTAYLLFHVFLMGFLIKKNIKAYILVPLLVGGLVAAFMTGSRGCTYSYILISAVMLLVEVRSDKIKSVFLQMLIPGIIVFLIFLINGKVGFEDTATLAFKNFNERRKDLDKQGEEKERLFSDVNQLLEFRGKYPIYGMGLGATYQGANAIYGTSMYVQEYGGYETEVTRYVLEGGFILVIFKMVILFSVFSQLYIPTLLKILVGILIMTFDAVVFSVYNSIFISMGLILLDNGYYQAYLKAKQSIN